ncbi:MAG: hypothetical protein LIQ31_15145 [Planctomycetes bacterium]|nr:hypothetical protein [Planctomycetota bacterium]
MVKVSTLFSSTILAAVILAAPSFAWGANSEIKTAGGDGGVIGGYRVVSVKKHRDSLDLGAHLTARVRESATGAVDLTAGVDASFRRRYADYGFQVG